MNQKVKFRQYQHTNKPESGLKD